MIVRVIINGLGHMGMPGLIAVQQISEILRYRHINVSIAGLIDVDRSLKPRVEFFTRHLSPSPMIAFADPLEQKPLYDVMVETLKLKDSGGRYLVYDASPTQFHFRNLSSCIDRDRIAFLVEKPMVTDKAELHQITARFASGQNESQRAADRILCDLIETQSSSCLHLQDLVASGDLVIEKLTFYRLNSSGTAKVFNPQERRGVQGGALLDKSIHDFSITAALLAPHNPFALEAEVKSATPLCFLACQDEFSDGLLNGYNQVWSGSRTAEDWPADGASVVDVVWTVGSRTVSATYNASWIGVTGFSELCEDRGLPGLSALEDRTAGCPEWYFHAPMNSYEEQDARLLEIEGILHGKRTELIVNFLTRGESVQPWIWNKTQGAEIPIPRRPFGSNSLARVLELGILAAAGNRVNCINGDASLVSHRELIRAHQMLLEPRIRMELEIKLGQKITGGLVDLRGKRE